MASRFCQLQPLIVHCAYCLHLRTYCDSYCKFTASVPDQATTSLFRIFGHISCDSRHVVYATWCVLCSRYIYVRETGNAFSLRIANHLSTIRCNRPVAVASHFNSAGHSLENIRFVGLQSLEHLLHLGSKALRDRRRVAETAWIRKLGTLEPLGVNVKADLTPLRKVPFVTTYTPQITSFINNLKPIISRIIRF